MFLSIFILMMNCWTTRWIVNKAILFLDVDGVLNPDSYPRFLKPLGFKRHRIKDLESEQTRYTVWLNKSHGEWLNSLTDIVDIYWCTSWNWQANVNIGPRIGLEKLPVSSAVPINYGNEWDKTTEIAKYAEEDRLLIWADDNIKWKDMSNLIKLGVDLNKFLPVHVKSEFGLQMHHISEIRKWIESHADHS